MLEAKLGEAGLLKKLLDGKPAEKKSHASNRYPTQP